MDFVEILQKAVGMNASDVHVVVNKPPMVRVRGEIMALPGYPAVKADESQRLVYSILFEAQRKKFEEKMELDTSFAIPNVARFRVNVFMARQGIEAVLRVINSVVPSPKDLGFTQSIEDLAKLPRGLVLVTGPTGSGKSTTLAAIIDIVNANRKDHILTIEDPIEYIYEPKQCIVRQREVGTTTQSFANALRAALREDPDVMLVGEMRDLETISLAITASETGHLVFGTLHTTDAPQTIDRIIDVFPPHQQQQVRIQLSTTLRAVVCQTLIPTADGKGRVAAREVMIVTPAIANLMREGKTHMIYNAIDTGSKFGMTSLDQSLEDLVRKKLINLDEALIKARDPEKVKSVLGHSGGGGGMK
ncbi:MAG: type IV pilus twitching motility protein PilT [Elusimicrobia bacterium]|nr:type IV pilus twitching motility protein PilT [Candidatus Obscuribacterium magneticum]